MNQIKCYLKAGSRNRIKSYCCKLLVLFILFFHLPAKSLWAQASAGTTTPAEWMNKVFIWLSVILIIAAGYVISGALILIRQRGGTQHSGFPGLGGIARNKTMASILFFIIIATAVVWALVYKAAGN